VRAFRRDEPRGGWAQHELLHLPVLATHLHAPSFLAHGHNDDLIEAAAEIRDTRTRADAGNGSRGTEHESMMLRARRNAKDRATPIRVTPTGLTPQPL
jgi:hypothetical protein